MTPEQAKRTQYLYEQFKPLVESGEASPAEIAAFKKVEAQLSTANNEVDATSATYRGALVGGTGGLSDEGAGVISAIKGDGYTAGREAHIERSRQLQQSNPEEFNTGRTAGGATLAGASMFAGGPALKGANWLTKVGVPGAIGGLIGMGQGQADYEMAGRPEGERLDYYKNPAMIGAATGAAAYPMGAAVGKVAKALRNAKMPTRTGYGAIPSRTMANAVSETQDAGVDVQRYLGGLSDEAMLADVPGSVQARAQGLAVVGGPGGTRLTREITSRADNAGARISQQMDDTIRPANAAFDQRKANAAERTGVWGPQYDAALNAEGAVQVRPLIGQLKEAQRVAGPDTAPVIARFVADLESKAKNGLIDPAQLHWIRSDLSDALGGMAGPSKSNAMLTTAKKSMDDVLDTVPGYAEARTGYANTKAMDRAIDDGQGALRGGRATASSPAEFQEQFDKLSDAQKDAFQTGVRRDVDAIMGTSSNDAAAAWRELNDKGWNQEKLRIVLGDDAADDIIKRLRSEKTFSETRGKVVAGSQTQMRSEAADALGGYKDPATGLQPGPVARVKNTVNDKVNSMVDSVLYYGRGNRNAELGEMLSLQGADRDRLVRALLDLEQRQSLPSPTSDRIARVVQALTAAGGMSLAANP